MTRALLAVLAAPAIAAAQTASPGVILFADGADGSDYVHGPYINADECNAQGAGQVWLTWNIGTSAIPTDSTYQVYASSQPHPTTGCATQANRDARRPGAQHARSHAAPRSGAGRVRRRRGRPGRAPRRDGAARAPSAARPLTNWQRRRGGR